ncbi:hypothetical protein C9426_05900 [Serratia sp. S1B]|nr:hypothetical protein C9426_05900 [Serratia sp. S1B]
MPFLLQTAWVLAVRCHPSHIVGYAPRDSSACCLQAIRSILGIASTLINGLIIRLFLTKLLAIF